MALNREKHVMLSYNHKSQRIVRMVYDHLTAENIKVWFDERDMHDNMYDSMAEAVTNAHVVCCFMSPEYETSKACKLELEKAQREGIRIIPCMVTNRKVWKPDRKQWLDIITGSIIAIDFSDTSETAILEKANELLRLIKQEQLVPTISPPKKLFHSIRTDYLERNTIKRIVNEGKSYPIEHSYINLALVESQRQHEREKQLDKQSKDKNAQLLETFEEIYGKKTEIDVMNIFHQCKDRIKKMLILGRAGIGKSTFCQYVTYRWAKDEIWPEYEVVILINLRSLTGARYPSGKSYAPMDLVKKEYFPFDDVPAKEVEKFKEKCNNGQVLWILDGYDEFAQSIPAQLEDVFNYIQSKQNHILTSRPYEIILSYDVKMEITGFTDDNIEKYIDQFFEQVEKENRDNLPRKETLLTFLRSNASIWGVSHIPVNLELICSLWADIRLKESRYLTMTQLYDRITEWLCRRYLGKQKKEYERLPKADVFKRCESELCYLETVAFNAMKANNIIITPQLLEKAAKETGYSLVNDSQIFKMGLLKSYNDNLVGNLISAEQQYYFVHLSFQEFFASRHLLKLFESSNRETATSFIDEHKYNQRFTLLFVFASGLLAQAHFSSYIDVFWSTIERKPRDLVGIRHAKLLIECINEMGDDTTFDRRSSCIDYIATWIEICTHASHYKVSHQLIESLERSQTLLKDMKLQEKMIQLLTYRNEHNQKKMLSILRSIDIIDPDQRIICAITNLLSDAHDSIRRSAIEAIGGMGEKAATSQVINNLAIALSDENYDVRMAASYVLAMMAGKSKTSEVIHFLVAALSDGNDHGRRSACAVLEKLGDKAATSEVINALIVVLADKNDDVRRSASRALKTLGQKAASTDAVNVVVTAISHENEHVRRSARQILQVMDARPATASAIRALVAVLSDENEKIRWDACVALGEMGEKSAVSEVINALVAVLSDVNEKVRLSACEALGKIGEKAVTTDVINALVARVSDINEKVRCDACRALGKMGEKAATSDVINALVAVLADENDDVQRIACGVLGKIGEKAATDQVINALFVALADGNEKVRSNACRAFSNMGEKAVTTDVINALVAAFSDENGKVRSSACEALGKIGEKAVTTDVINALVARVSDINEKVRCDACRALWEMGVKAATNEVINALVAALSDVNEEVRLDACAALWTMAEKAVTTDVINALVAALSDVYGKVRLCACRALRKMGEKAATNEVINAVIAALSDGNDDVRSTACEALGRMGVKAANSDVINALIAVLADSNDNVQRTAFDVLVKMGENRATIEVIDALVATLSSRNDDVGRAAFGVLVKIGESTATVEVINALVVALEDENEEVRSNACRALWKMGVKAATNEVINALIAALSDINQRVRSRACEALWKMGEKAATNEVINALSTALSDGNDDVRRTACEALGEMGEKAATSDVINALVVVLADENDDVRRIACGALVKMGEKSATIEVINALVIVLSDGNDGFRRDAREVLENVGVKVGTTRAINAIAATLSDDDYYVKCSICGVLEKMVEKGNTAEVIRCLSIACMQGKTAMVSIRVQGVLSFMLHSYSSLRNLTDHDFLEFYRLVVDCSSLDCTSVSFTELVLIFFERKLKAASFLALFLALVQGIAVVISDRCLSIFGSREVKRLSIVEADVGMIFEKYCEDWWNSLAGNRVLNQQLNNASVPTAQSVVELPKKPKICVII